MHSTCAICQSPVIPYLFYQARSFNPLHFNITNNHLLRMRPIGTTPWQVLINYRDKTTTIGLYDPNQLSNTTMHAPITLQGIWPLEEITAENLDAGLDL